ncbi:MFS transporter [Alteromonadaceae bacterium M269]|nr:MFS transporter [Alteromonadaceae bacterium M269]
MYNVMMKNNPERLVAQYALFAAFGGFVFGLDAANISGALRFISSLFELNNIQQGMVVGCALLGVIVALFFTGTLCEHFGRSKVLLGIGFTYSLSTVISTTALNYEMLVVGRFIGGVAFASITVSAMYIGEIAPAKLRGKFVSVNQLMIGLGLLIAFITNYFLLQTIEQITWITNENVWRIMLGAELIANALWIFLLWRIPESPRWLIKQGRESEAREVLLEIAGEESKDTLVSNIKESLKEDAQLTTTQQLKALFDKRLRVVLLVAIFYAIVQGATGMNAVLFFAPIVFEQVGMSVDDSFAQTISIGVVGLVATLFAILFIEQLGRRLLTLVGLVLVIVGHSSTFYGFNQANYTFDQEAVSAISEPFNQLNIDANKLETLVGRKFESDVALKKELANHFTKKELPLVEGVIINATIRDIKATWVLFGIFAFLAAFNLSIGPIMWVIFSEIFPNTVRSIALPFAALVQTVSSWVIQQFFPWQLDNMGVANIFLAYAAVGLFGLIAMYLMLPETKGKSIEAIEIELTKNKEALS